MNRRRARSAGLVGRWQATPRIPVRDGPYTLAEARGLLNEAHPNCQCGLVPYLEEENDEEED